MSIEKQQPTLSAQASEQAAVQPSPSISEATTTLNTIAADSLLLSEGRLLQQASPPVLQAMTELPRALLQSTREETALEKDIIPQALGRFVRYLQSLMPEELGGIRDCGLGGTMQEFPPLGYKIEHALVRRNGQMRDVTLMSLGRSYIGKNERLEIHAALAYQAMNKAFREEFHCDLPLVDGFRSRGEQRARKVARGNLAADPGQSQHELGLAVDISVSSVRGSLGWLQQNALRYGFSGIKKRGEKNHFNFNIDRLEPEARACLEMHAGVLGQKDLVYLNTKSSPVQRD